jgi:acyl carrier protein
MDTVYQELFQEFINILEEEGIPHDGVSMDTHLKSLELSSLQFLRVVGALEDIVGVPLDSSVREVETVGALIAELGKLKDAAA